MLWTPTTKYRDEPFNTEAELEDAIRAVSADLFGPNRIYLDVKKKIGAKGRTNNIPDAYLVDLSSAKQPILRVVENELEKHDPLRHIAVQILEFSLSYEATPHKVKGVVRTALQANTDGWRQCERYATANGYDSVDHLLDRMVHEGEFAALVIIDALSDELEKVLVSKFKFGVEVLTLSRYRSPEGERVYEFEPFLADLGSIAAPTADGDGGASGGSTVDPSDIDTIVVPARDEGFQETVLGENRWYAVRIHGSMIPKIKHLAVYRVAPVSAITHIAPVQSIEPWHNSGKYVLNFAEAIEETPRPIPMIPRGKVKAPQSIRYTSRDRLMAAKNLDEVF